MEFFMDEESLISQEEKEKLTLIATRISKLRNKLLIVTSNLTPINYMEEMDKFFESDTYNPQYIYRPIELPDITQELDEIRSELSQLTIPDDLCDHIEGVLHDLQAMERAKKSIGTEDFAENANALFDWGKDRLDMLLANTPKVKFALNTKHKLQNAQDIKERFEKVLESYNITNLPVLIDDFSTHIISITSKSIKIGSKVQRYQCNVDRLVVHEIESHALQIINVLNNTTRLPDLTKYSNMNLYAEGLAVYNEITTRKITPEAFDLYYNRIRAVHLLDKSFRDIFEALAKYVPMSNAYVITYRVKRGTADTSQPGGFPKDAAYLLGYHEIDNLVRDGFSQRLLYATKSPVLTSLLRKYDLLDTSNIITPRFG